MSGCSPQCGCASAAETPDLSRMAPEAAAPFEPASINGVPLQKPSEALNAATLRQRACTELLRQAAQAEGLLDQDDEPGWTDASAISETASEAIETLLEHELSVPEPSESECRRHHEANASHYSTGERVHARHILFAVTPGVDVGALRQRAEHVLLEARCQDRETDASATFAALAGQWSNCPSSQNGGDLGWLDRQDCAPEFARELFGHAEVGVLPRLVHSRFGLHVVEVLERQAGQPMRFDEVRPAVAMALQRQTYVAALRQYLNVLAGRADVRGVDLAGADTLLVQ